MTLPALGYLVSLLASPSTSEPGFCSLGVLWSAPQTAGNHKSMHTLTLQHTLLRCDADPGAPGHPRDAVWTSYISGGAALIRNIPFSWLAMSLDEILQ